MCRLIIKIPSMVNLCMVLCANDFTNALYLKYLSSKYGKTYEEVSKLLYIIMTHKYVISISSQLAKVQNQAEKPVVYFAGYFKVILLSSTLHWHHLGM